MTIEELIASCNQSYITLVMRGKWPRLRNTKRFMGRSGPVGTIVNELEGGRIVVMFKSKEVLAFIRKDLLHQKDNSNE